MSEKWLVKGAPPDRWRPLKTKGSTESLLKCWLRSASSIMTAEIVGMADSQRSHARPRRPAHTG